MEAQHSTNYAVLERIRALEDATRQLYERVVKLEQHSQAVKASRADAALNVDIKAARGISPGKGDTASLIEMREFIMDILSPDVYGYAVSREVRNAARRVLGIDPKE